MCRCDASGFCCFGPMAFAVIAFALSLFANASCSFVDVAESAFLRTRLPFSAPVSMGFWCIETVYDRRYSIADFRLDRKFQYARYLGAIPIVLGLFIIVFHFFAGCFRFSPNAFRFVGFFGICASMFQGLSFLILQSGVCTLGCSLSSGANCAIAACVFWFFSGTFSCASGKKAEEKLETADITSPKEEKGRDEVAGTNDDP